MSRFGIPPDPTPEQVAKLPVWAQDHLRRTEMAMREAVEANAEARLATDPAGSSATLEPCSFGGLAVGLGANARVRFKIESEDPRPIAREESYIDVRIEDGQLYVTGGTPLVIVPVVTNVVKIGLRRG